MAMACTGKFLTSSSLLAPRYWEMMDEMALRDCPNTQISMDKKAVTTPTAAKDSVAFTEICPTMAASVSERIGSEIPAMMAGTASLLMWLRLIGVSNSTIFRVLFFVPRFCCYCFYFSDPISPLFLCLPAWRFYYQKIYCS